MCLRQFCVIRIELFIPLRCAKVHFGRNPLQLKCRQLQGPACRCGNLILRVYYLGLKTGPGHRDHTSYLPRALRRYWRQPESQLQPHFPKSNGWFDLKLGRSHCMTGRGEVEEVKFVYVGVFFFWGMIWARSWRSKTEMVGKKIRENGWREILLCGEWVALKLQVIRRPLPPLPRLRHRPRVSLLVLAAAQEHLALKQPNKKSHWEARSERERKRCERMCEG